MCCSEFYRGSEFTERLCSGANQMTLGSDVGGAGGRRTRTYGLAQRVAVE